MSDLILICDLTVSRKSTLAKRITKELLKRNEYATTLVRLFNFYGDS